MIINYDNFIDRLKVIKFDGVEICKSFCFCKIFFKENRVKKKKRSEFNINFIVM